MKAYKIMLWKGICLIIAKSRSDYKNFHMVLPSQLYFHTDPCDGQFSMIPCIFSLFSPFHQHGLIYKLNLFLVNLFEQYHVLSVLKINASIFIGNEFFVNGNCFCKKIHINNEYAVWAANHTENHNINSIP